MFWPPNWQDENGLLGLNSGDKEWKRNVFHGVKITIQNLFLEYFKFVGCTYWCIINMHTNIYLKILII